MTLQETRAYDDIINLPHHQSRKHPHMSRHQRAAQFMPFAALTGYNQVIEQTAKNAETAIAQAEALERHGIRFDAVLSLEVADSVIEARMTGRRTCHACGATYHVVMAPPKQEGLCDKCGGVLEQRKDDQPETVKHRLEIYHSQTEPLKGFYEEKGVLKRVPDLGGIEETNTKIMELLGK